MNNEQNYDRERKKRIPLIFWFGGALVTGGLLGFAYLNEKNFERAESLEQKLVDTEATLTKEKQALIDKLGNTTASYEALQAEYDATIASLADEKSNNGRLASFNASHLKREKELMSRYDSLAESVNQLNSEYETLKMEAGILRSTVESLQAKLQQSEQMSSDQASEIMRQIDIIRSDSLAAFALMDSLKREDVAGFFNSTDVTGGAGLKERNVPYSKYFFGLTTVNGYVINKHFMTGIGVGLHSYNDGGLMAPVFLDLKYTFNKRNFTPYLFADGGILVNFDDIEVPSFFVNPGLGITKRLGQHFGLNLGAGLFIQKDVPRHSFVNVKLGVVYRKK